MRVTLAASLAFFAATAAANRAIPVGDADFVDASYDHAMGLGRVPYDSFVDLEGNTNQRGSNGATHRGTGRKSGVGRGRIGIRLPYQSPPFFPDTFELPGLSKRSDDYDYEHDNEYYVDSYNQRGGFGRGIGRGLGRIGDAVSPGDIASILDMFVKRTNDGNQRVSSKKSLGKVRSNPKRPKTIRIKPTNPGPFPSI
ncbi:hypothetical protein DL89DRAFT_272008, partial [Linderina pennispora]